jgi:hypothetical protein
MAIHWSKRYQFWLIFLLVQNIATSRGGEQLTESHFLYLLLQQAIHVYERQLERLLLGLASKL